jgi:glycosyltransferase involved in cell wall biosynthesis
MNVSVIATVYNERGSIQCLLDSLAGQTRPPDEVVICDGGSTDGTAQFVEEYARRYAHLLPNLRLLVAPGANISRGRNLAIAAAAGPVVASTDAGVRLERTWLEQLIAPWAAPTGKEPPLAAAGVFVADAQGVFQTAMAATVLPLVDEIDPHRFLPSSRSVAFTKAAWAQAGGYPEWLDYCEDLVFDFALNDLRPDRPTAFAWAPGAVVHFRPRTNLRQFWRQYYLYARGDGKAGLWPKRHAIRYATYFLVLPALLGHAFFGFFARWLGWLGLAAGIFLYCRRPWQRLTVLSRDLSQAQRLAAGTLVPVIRVVGDVAKMVGYPIGILWRLKHRREHNR